MSDPLPSMSCNLKRSLGLESFPHSAADGYAGESLHRDHDSSNENAYSSALSQLTPVLYDLGVPLGEVLSCQETFIDAPSNLVVKINCSDALLRKSAADLGCKDDQEYCAN